MTVTREKKKKQVREMDAMMAQMLDVARDC